MGGKALKEIYTRRYGKLEFEAIIPELVEKLEKHFTKVVPTQYYREKDSFGDADMLVLLDKPVNFDIEEMLIAEFGATQVASGNGVHSFDYKELQVDLILTPLSNWETAQVYFSWNDLHNLVGKVAQKFGLKWGYDGLKYVYYTGKDNSYKMGNIYLSKDHRKSLEFLGFDVERYDKGFNNLDEIYQFVMDSKYFNPHIFDLALQNKTNRDRDKKRTTYAKWLELIEPMKETTPGYQFKRDKKEYFDHIQEHFPKFKPEYDALTLKEERRKAITAKFNGHTLMNLGVDPKEIGKHMAGFKDYVVSSSLPDMNFDLYVELHTAEEIEAHFKEYYEKLG